MSGYSKAARFILISLFLLGAATLYFSHLGGYMPFDTDENRAFHYQPYSPLIFLIGSFFTNLFKSYDAPRYVLGGIGFINVVLLFVLIRRLGDRRLAWVTAAVYLSLSYPLLYAKIIQYAILAIFYVLCALICFVEGVRTSKRRWFAVVGVISALLVTTNPSTYSLVGALILLPLAGRRFRIGERSGLRDSLTILGAAVVAYIIIEIFFYFAFAKSFSNLLSGSIFLYRDDGLLEIRRASVGPGALVRLVKDFLVRHIDRGDPAEAFRTFFLFILAGFGLKASLKKGDLAARWLGLYSLIALVPLCLAALFSVHILHERCLVWLSVPVAYFAARGLVGFLDSGRASFRIITVVAAAFYFLGAYGLCADLTLSVPDSREIADYLKAHHISRSRVLTLYPLLDYQNMFGSQRVPTLDVPLLSTPEERRLQKFRIDWPRIYALYSEGLCGYYLSSGLCEMANVGEDDVFLKRIKPVKVWYNHPGNNRYWPNVYRKPCLIELYALSDIFDHPANFFTLVREFYKENAVQRSEKGAIR